MDARIKRTAGGSDAVSQSDLSEPQGDEATLKGEAS